MAQLPSGRHVAIQTTPLFALIEAACEPEAVITRLLQIEQAADFAPHIDVMFFREVADAPVDVQRLQALMWETDCHLLQSSEFHDPIDALLRVDNDVERGDVP